MEESFLAAVRKVAATGIWSQGVKLARDGAVSLVQRAGAEATLRVRERGRAVSPTVILYLGDDEWDCDCEARVSPCNHVAAAAIALAQGFDGPAEPGPAEGPAQTRATPAELGYRLTVQHGALHLARVIVDGEALTPLDLPLSDRAARRIATPALEPTHDDMAIDRVLARKLAGDVPLEHLGTVLEALARAPHVWLSGEATKTDGTPVSPEARVEDAKLGGLCLTIAAPSDLRVIALGVGTLGGVLRPLAETPRFGLRFERLPIVRTFAAAELGALATDVLPDLERTMIVEVRTRRVPRRDATQKPRIHFELSHEHGALHVLPLLVYGDPEVGRVDAGKLILMGSPAPIRDEPRERQLLARLRDDLSLVPGRRVRFDGRDAATFADRLERFQRDDPTAHAFGADVRELVARVTAVGSDLDVVFELPTDEDDAPDVAPRRALLSDVAQAYRDGLGIVALEGGGFARLPAGFLERYGHAVLDLVAAKTDPETRAAAPLVAELAGELGCALPEGLQELASVVGPLDGIPTADLPPGFTAELRPYQRRGVDWLAALGGAKLGGLLADDMGLGKTVQALAALKGRSLVVCPRSVVHNWASEIARFRPGLRVHRYEGAGRALDPTADVTLTTYALLRIDADELAAVQWDVALLDEAQAIKNADSQVARAAFGLKAGARFCLTGTPIENRLAELWSLMRFAVPGLLGGQRDFAIHYERAMAEGDPEASRRLRKRIRPFVLRRTKKEVLPDLPPRTEAVLYCELAEEERGLYDAVRAATRKEVLEKLAHGGGVLAALEALLRMRQAACHPGLLPGRSAQSSSKIERLVAALEELAAEGSRALVFSQWTSLLDLVEPHLHAASIGFSRLDGSTRDREGVVSGFQAADGPPVLLLSLKAGGTGLNLTAADHVFLLDPWWNPAVEEQAADRAHRIGQDKPVMVYRLVAKDTVEERILLLQDKKRALADLVVSGGGAASGISRDDLLDLLAG